MLCFVGQNISHFSTVCINWEVSLVFGVQTKLFDQTKPIPLIPVQKVICKTQNNYQGLYITDLINPPCNIKVQISEFSPNHVN